MQWGLEVEVGGFLYQCLSRTRRGVDWVLFLQPRSCILGLNYRFWHPIP